MMNIGLVTTRAPRVFLPRSGTFSSAKPAYFFSPITPRLPATPRRRNIACVVAWPFWRTLPSIAEGSPPAMCAWPTASEMNASAFSVRPRTYGESGSDSQILTAAMRSWLATNNAATQCCDGWEEKWA